MCGTRLWNFVAVMIICWTWPNRLYTDSDRRLGTTKRPRTMSHSAREGVVIQFVFLIGMHFAFNFPAAQCLSIRIGRTSKRKPKSFQLTRLSKRWISPANHLFVSKQCDSNMHFGVMVTSSFWPKSLFYAGSIEHTGGYRTKNKCRLSSLTSWIKFRERLRMQHQG